MTTEKLIINGVDHSVFNLEWAKRGGVCAIADHSEFGLFKYIKPIDKALHYFCDLEYLDDFGATMAPNDMRMATPAECEAAFLSRLCGGEHLQATPILRDAFLSRLCGGEHDAVGGGDRGFFLSRLCGGEQFDFRKALLAKFLSRLCGGEQIWK